MITKFKCFFSIVILLLTIFSYVSNLCGQPVYSRSKPALSELPETRVDISQMNLPKLQLKKLELETEIDGLLIEYTPDYYLIRQKRNILTAINQRIKLLSPEKNLPKPAPVNCPMPAIQKIMPGMTLLQAEKVIKRKFRIMPSVEFPKVNTAKRATLTNYQNASRVNLDLIGNRIYAVSAIYKDSNDWNNLEEFAKTAVKNLSLPLEELQLLGTLGSSSSPSVVTSATLKCEPVFLMAEKTINGFQLLVSDLYYYRQAANKNSAIFQKDQDKREKRKSTFKP